MFYGPYRSATGSFKSNWVALAEGLGPKVRTKATFNFPRSCSNSKQPRRPHQIIHTLYKNTSARVVQTKGDFRKFVAYLHKA